MDSTFFCFEFVFLHNLVEKKRKCSLFLFGKRQNKREEHHAFILMPFKRQIFFAYAMMLGQYCVVIGVRFSLKEFLQGVCLKAFLHRRESGFAIFLVDRTVSYFDLSPAVDFSGFTLLALLIRHGADVIKSIFSALYVKTNLNTQRDISKADKFHYVSWKSFQQDAALIVL